MNNLDYSITDTQKRLKIVEDITNKYNDYLYNDKISEKDKNYILEKLGDYLDKPKNKQQDFEERDIINDYLVAGGSDSLRQDGESQGKYDKNIYFNNSSDSEFTGNVKKRIKQKINIGDTENSKVLNQYDFYRFILWNMENKDYTINKTINGLKDDMVFIKDFEQATIYFKNKLIDNGSSNSSLFEIDFFEPKDYDNIFKILPFKDLSGNLKNIYSEFEKLEKYLDISDDKIKMLDILKEGKSNKYEKLYYKSNNRRDLLSENKKAVYNIKSLSNKLGWTYKKTQEMYYKLQEDCFEAYYKYYENEIYYIYIVKGKYKKCSKCSEIKIIQNFRKDASRNDGLFPYCKECEKEYNNCS